MQSSFIYKILAFGDKFAKDKRMVKKGKVSEAFALFCSQNGIKRTIQRFAVFEAVYGSALHPSVDTVFKSVSKTLPMIKAESVYRILADFQQAGLIKKMSQFSVMRYECNAEEHGHFICSECGEIMDIEKPRVELPGILKGAAQVSVTLNGLCPSCARRQGA